MGGIIGKQDRRKRFYTRKQITASKGIFSRLVRSPRLTEKRKKVKTHSRNNLDVAKGKLSRLNENMGQFSVLPYMAGDKMARDFKELPAILNYEEILLLNQQEILGILNDIGIPVFANQEDIQPDFPAFQLPESLIYEGYHESGFHIFAVKAQIYENLGGEKDSRAIQEAISSVIGEEVFLLTYEDTTGGPAFLPNDHSRGNNLFHDLCVRFGNQLSRIVFYRPSWYVLYSLNEPSESIFSNETMHKMNFADDAMQYGRLTGFPGEIITRPH